MAEWMFPYIDDYTNLGFDVARHREAFRRFADLGMSQAGVRAALIAREMVAYGYPSAKFRIGSTSDLEMQEKAEAVRGCAAFVSIFQNEDPAEAERVQAEVWSYFLRHFPGRCLALLPSQHLPDDPKHVYITFFAPDSTEDDISSLERAIVVDRSARTLSLIENGQTVGTFPVLVGRNRGPKQMTGDEGTPEGRYRVARMLPDEDAVGAGYYKGLMISYPGVHDAARGLATGLINQEEHDEIMGQHKRGEVPSQETQLGSYLAIHGGLAPDEPFERGTLGCVVLRNADMDRVYDFSRVGTPIIIRA